MGAGTQDRRMVRLRTLLQEARRDLNRATTPADRAQIQRLIDRYLDEYHSLLSKQ